MVCLTRLGRGLSVPIFGKCEHLNPGGSVKDRLALAIVLDAESNGLLHPGDTLVEATAGNTGIGLALVAALRGYRLLCVMPEKMSLSKRESLAILGAELIITRNAPPDSPDHFQNVARRIARETGGYLTDQFCHPANARIHQETTGPEILAQCQGKVGAFVAGVGTGGTLTGVGRFLKEHCPAVRIVLADPVGSPLGGWVRNGVPGPDSAYQVEGIGTSNAPEVFDKSVVDDVEMISDQESFSVTGRLMREEGLLVGGSSGTAAAAALRVAARGDLEGPVVTLLADSWDRYWSTPWMQALATRPQP